MNTPATTPQFANLRQAAPTAPKAKGADKLWSIKEILNESSRKPGYCPHVDEPQEPAWHRGSRAEVEARAEAWHQQAKTADGKRVRSTSPGLACAVISLPRRRMEGWPAYRDDTIAFFVRTYSNRVAGIVEHIDEAHPHLHIYLVPRDAEGFGVVHPGYAASRAARRLPGNHVTLAFNGAMSAWQDDFHAAVSSRHGLERLGPKRMRMERTEWTRNAAAEKAVKAKLDAADIGTTEVIKAAKLRAGALAQDRAAIDAARADLAQQTEELKAVAGTINAASGKLGEREKALKGAALAVRSREERLAGTDVARLDAEIQRLTAELARATAALGDESVRRQFREEASAGTPFEMKAPKRS